MRLRRCRPPGSHSSSRERPLARQAGRPLLFPASHRGVSAELPRPLFIHSQFVRSAIYPQASRHGGTTEPAHGSLPYDSHHKEAR
jgi:hypothetical protein